jgi:site-specific DNA-cytosine methylase
MLGQDVRDFDVLPGRFDGVIGGPPCQPFSKAKVGEYSVHENLIPEFVRIVEQASPQWAVMENVPEAASAAPSWEHVFLKDWDCGGNTFRKRGFWFYGIPTPPVPQKRPGRAAYSVLATSWNIRKRSGKHNGLTAYEAARLQGYEDLATTLIERWPGTFCSNGKWSGVSGHSRNVLAVHMMGNGVPRALGEYVARHVAQVTCE